MPYDCILLFGDSIFTESMTELSSSRRLRNTNSFICQICIECLLPTGTILEGDHTEISKVEKGPFMQLTFCWRHNVPHI